MPCLAVPVPCRAARLKNYSDVVDLAVEGFVAGSVPRGAATAAERRPAGGTYLAAADLPPSMYMSERTEWKLIHFSGSNRIKRIVHFVNDDCRVISISVPFTEFLFLE